MILAEDRFTRALGPQAVESPQCHCEIPKSNANGFSIYRFSEQYGTVTKPHLKTS